VSVESFDAFDLEKRVGDRAALAGLQLDVATVAAIAKHARSVVEHNERLQLTTVTRPEEFLERHIGESLEGAALLDSRAQGCLLDLGSGNGYPAIPIAATLRELEPVCTEASEAKAAFLRETLATCLGKGQVWDKQIQRPGDFDDRVSIRVLTCRAMGNWERIFPRVAPMLASNGIAMLWAGESVEAIATRDAWQRLSLVARHTLPGRQRSWIWCFRSVR